MEAIEVTIQSTRAAVNRKCKAHGSMEAIEVTIQSTRAAVNRKCTVNRKCKAHGSVECSVCCLQKNQFSSDNAKDKFFLLRVKGKGSDLCGNIASVNCIGITTCQ